MKGNYRSDSRGFPIENPEKDEPPKCINGILITETQKLILKCLTNIRLLLKMGNSIEVKETDNAN